MEDTRRPGDQAVLELTWQPTLADLGEVFATHNRVRHNGRKALIIALAALAALLIGWLLHQVPLMVIAAGPLIGVGARPLLQPLFVRYFWWRSPALARPTTMVIVPHRGFDLQVGGSTTRIAWSTIEGFHESQSLFVLARRDVRLSLLYLPKRALREPNTVEQLRDVLRIGSVPQVEPTTITATNSDERIGRVGPHQDPADPMTPAFEWQPTPADVTEMLAAHDRLHRRGTKFAVAAVVSAALAVIGLALNQEFIATLGINGVIFAALLWFVIRPMNARSLWRRNAAVQAPLRARISARTGIQLQTPQTNSLYNWNDLAGYLETPGLFIIRVPGFRVSLVHLAKRAMAPHEVDYVRHLLATRPNHQVHPSSPMTGPSPENVSRPAR